MKHYAEGTSVPVARSKAELDALLQKHGATQRGFMDDDNKGEATVLFDLQGRKYRLAIPLPKMSAFATKTTYGKERPTTPDDRAKLYEQACRERWRAVLLLVKAKLELVALGVSNYEREFLADLLLPGGQRLHDVLSFDPRGRPLLGSGT